MSRAYACKETSCEYKVDMCPCDLVVTSDWQSAASNASPTRGGPRAEPGQPPLGRRRRIVGPSSGTPDGVKWVVGARRSKDRVALMIPRFSKGNCNLIFYGPRVCPINLFPRRDPRPPPSFPTVRVGGRANPHGLGGEGSLAIALASQARLLYGKKIAKLNFHETSNNSKFN